MDHITTLSPDLLAFTEPNLAFDQVSTRFDVLNTIKRHLPAARLIASSSPIPSLSSYKPGGCMTISTKDINCRVTKQYADPMGRWTYVSLATKKSSFVTILTVYKPCRTTIEQAGPMTVFRQQWLHLRQQGHINPNPRDQFDSDLLQLITTLQDQQHRIIMAGDFNETFSSSVLLQTFYSMGLRDAVSTRHPNLPPFRTYNRGTQVIDYVLVSAELLPFITTSSYEPFNLHMTSDHRSIIVDLDKDLFLGKPHPLQTPDHRGFTSTDAHQTEKYIHYLHQYWTDYRIDNRLQHITTLPRHHPNIRDLLNHLDNDMTRAFLKAELKIKRKDRPPWSPILREASLRVKWLKLHLDQFKRKCCNASAIQHTRERMKSTTSLPSITNLSICQYHLRRAQKALRKLRQKANELRIEHLELLVARYRLSNESDKEKIIKRILKSEATKRCFKKLRWLIHPISPGVSFIQREPQDPSSTIFDRFELETTILERNQRHFNQCAGTPFTSGALRRLNWAADSLDADMLLDGTADPSSYTDDPILQHLLTQCQRLQAEQPSSVTYSTLQQLFKNWKESTSTSPSGVHLGHYKTIFQSQSTPSKQIAASITSLLQTLLTHGISLRRWNHVVNIMIHKVEGSYLLNKLRVIHLFEADYNGLLGIQFNRTILYRAEQSHLLNDSQWGSRPQRQTIDALILKELTYDLANLTRTSLATFDNDAQGCYDRVPCTLAMLASRRLGADKTICRLQADNLQNISHRLKTAYGISTSTYRSTDTFEIHGQGQGSRSAPPTWVFISSLLLDCMSQLGKGLSFSCPYNQLVHTRHNDAFVDDVTGFTNLFLSELSGATVLPSLISNMQSDANLWSHLLHLSGGKLSLPKCLYYILSWSWQGGRPKHLPPDQINPTITIRDPETNTEVPIRHLNCDVAHRTLGQMKSPISNPSAHHKFLERKSTEWLGAIQQTKLTRPEARAAYEALWFPSISYGLGTTNMSYAQLQSLQKPILNHILPQLGYNRHFPRAVVHGTNFAGMKFKHLYTEQGIQHVMLFLKYFRSNNSIGQFLALNLRWVRLIAGWSVCPLRRPQYPCHHIPHPWFQTLIRFLNETNSTIDTIDPYRPYSRINDSCILEDFLLFNPPNSHLTHLNLCRLFLRVTTLSDIVSSNGRYILRNCWTGRTPQPSPHLWPVQQRPPPRAWRLWRVYLAKAYLPDEDDTFLSRLDLTLTTTLGSWLPSNQIHQKRSYYVDPNTLHLYRRSNREFDLYVLQSSTRTTYKFQWSTTSTVLPPSAYPVDPYVASNLLELSRHTIIPAAPTPSHPRTFPDYIARLAKWERLLLTHHQNYCSDYHVLTSKLQQPLIIATDGSVNNQKGSYGWVIATTQGTLLASGKGPTHGEAVCSFRSEGYGILAALRFLLQVRRYHFHPSTNTTIQWWCDSESLIKRLDHHPFILNDPNRSTLPDHDVEVAILKSQPWITQSLTTTHLHSHQHDNTPLHLLPLPYRLNRMADDLADDYNESMTHPLTHVPLLAPARCQLQLGSLTPTRSLPYRLRQEYHRPASILHLRHRFNLSIDTYQDINWEAFEKAFATFSPSSQRILRRWLYGFLPTQRRLHRNGTSPDDLCPRCSQVPETDAHFLQCQGALSWSQYLFHPLEALCLKMKVTHWFEHAITLNLIRYLDNRPPLYPHPTVTTCVTNQHHIGWVNCFFGLFSNQWISAQNRVHDNGFKCLKSIIHLLLNAVLQRWNERNSLLHQTSSNTETETHKRLAAKITALYECKDKVLPGDRHLFSKPLSELLSQTTSQLQLFVQNNTSIIRSSLRQQDLAIQRQHRPITAYFPPSNSTSTADTQVTLDN